MCRLDHSFDEPGSRKGRRLDLEAAYREHREPLLRHLRALTGDPHEAEDLAHEAFLRLAANPGPKRNLRAWLYTVARNLVRERARTRMNRARLRPRAGPFPRHAPRPDEEFERRRAAEEVRRALAGLRLRDRQILLMREEGFTHREIAEAVGVTPSSVGTLVARALRRLAESLAEERGVPTIEEDDTAAGARRQA